MPEDWKQDRTGQKKIAGYLIVLVAFLLLWPLTQSGDSVEIFGVTVPIWLVALVFYALGLGASWAFQRSKRA